MQRRTLSRDPRSRARSRRTPSFVPRGDTPPLLSRTASSDGGAMFTEPGAAPDDATPSDGDGSPLGADGRPGARADVVDADGFAWPAPLDLDAAMSRGPSRSIMRDGSTADLRGRSERRVAFADTAAPTPALTSPTVAATPAFVAPQERPIDAPRWRRETTADSRQALTKARVAALTAEAEAIAAYGLVYRPEGSKATERVVPLSVGGRPFDVLLSTLQGQQNGQAPLYHLALLWLHKQDVAAKGKTAEDDPAAALLEFVHTDHDGRLIVDACPDAFRLLLNAARGYRSANAVARCAPSVAAFDLLHSAAPVGGSLLAEIAAATTEPTPDTSTTKTPRVAPDVAAAADARSASLAVAAAVAKEARERPVGRHALLGAHTEAVPPTTGLASIGGAFARPCAPRARIARTSAPAVSTFAPASFPAAFGHTEERQRRASHIPGVPVELLQQAQADAAVLGMGDALAALFPPPVAAAFDAADVFHPGPSTAASGDTLVRAVTPLLSSGRHHVTFRVARCQFLGIGVLSSAVADAGRDVEGTRGCGMYYMSGLVHHNYPQHQCDHCGMEYGVLHTIDVDLDLDARKVTWLRNGKVVLIVSLAPLVPESSSDSCSTSHTDDDSGTDDGRRMGRDPLRYAIGCVLRGGSEVSVLGGDARTAATVAQEQRRQRSEERRKRERESDAAASDERSMRRFLRCTDVRPSTWGADAAGPATAAPVKSMRHTQRPHGVAPEHRAQHVRGVPGSYWVHTQHYQTRAAVRPSTPALLPAALSGDVPDPAVLPRGSTILSFFDGDDA